MAGRSVVYASFGSIAKPDAAQMAEGLYNTGKAFPWVVRASESSKLPENFTDMAKERGLVVTWSPQLEVVAHPAVGCFVTHCGWNSTMEGLGAGVPCADGGDAAVVGPEHERQVHRGRVASRRASAPGRGRCGKEEGA